MNKKSGWYIILGIIFASMVLLIVLPIVLVNDEDKTNKEKEVTANTNEQKKEKDNVTKDDAEKQKDNVTKNDVEKQKENRKISVKDIKAMSDEEIQRLDFSKDQERMSNKVFDIYVGRLLELDKTKEDTENNVDVDSKGVYNDEELNQRVHNSMKRSMQLFNNRKDDDLKSYEVETKIDETGIEKPDVIVTLNLKGNYEYDQDLLQNFEDHVMSNFSFYEADFKGYFKHLTIEFKEKDNEIGHVTLDLDKKQEEGTLSDAEKVIMNK